MLLMPCFLPKGIAAFSHDQLPGDYLPGQLFSHTHLTCGAVLDLL